MKKPPYRIKIPDKHLRRDTFRSGGPGGQYQNVTETGVRYTHLPTRISAESRSERSQDANDKIARASLEEKLIRLVLLKQGQSAHDAWKNKPDVSHGHKMRSYVLCGHRRVLDHDTGWEGDPAAVLDGKIDGLLRARLAAASRQRPE